MSTQQDDTPARIRTTLVPGVPQVPTANVGHPRVITHPTETRRVGGRVPRPGGLR